MGNLWRNYNGWNVNISSEYKWMKEDFTHKLETLDMWGEIHDMDAYEIQHSSE
jgi:hypothetical protein